VSGQAFGAGLFGFEVHVNPVLAGGKKAVRQGNRMYVSPAMYDLISHAEGDELESLLKSIECVTIPEMPSVYEYVPMFTAPKMPTPDEWNPWRKWGAK
jgi:hypothetical protein